MSIDRANPKTGRALEAPYITHSTDRKNIGRICCLMDAPHDLRQMHIRSVDKKPFPNFMYATMPWDATRQDCQEMAHALENVTPEILTQVQKHTDDKHLDHVCKKAAKYLRRLKYGYMTIGDESYCNYIRLVYKKLHTLGMKVFTEERKFWLWLAKPNDSFPANFSPEDLINFGQIQVIIDHLNNRLLGIPH